ncbi:adenylate kinase [Rathayibacter iranicus]|uniref:Adenylate kinase n=2 Tax=Rathayibacter iranicus TaxID=59737 RepID=A0AAD1AFI1_9MICO|nr:adenylate kinase [Rathayibacter iranicus]AZZ56060.1 adenylate kinase [Rathayibacter iranicus]MWV30251.1 adenylate kinase [Rathayibacter iranicus NCPPB 2253 = VKM Ac-1602]PPI46339.1 adenylate kinase [Rathayibacter iranicus]PPI59938.1 adenylate kinase [Rathayibacter iranicus]PPI71257.1 adenylate kinase [Rathayibacter iranicus]
MSSNPVGFRLLLIGPPGAGKGTQAARLSDILEVPAISTGDIFRANVANETELGLQAKTYLDAGHYVPDELTNAIVHDRLQEADASTGFLLDGYPRTTEQVDELDRILAADHNRLDAVVQLTADPDEVVARLLKRSLEQGRSDDTEEVIRRRLALYEEQTAPLIDVYAARGIVVVVDGLGPVEEVTERIVVALEGHRVSRLDNPAA